MLLLAKLAHYHVKVLPDAHASDQGIHFKMFTRHFIISNALCTLWDLLWYILYLSQVTYMTLWFSAAFAQTFQWKSAKTGAVRLHPFCILLVLIPQKALWQIYAYHMNLRIWRQRQWRQLKQRIYIYVHNLSSEWQLLATFSCQNQYGSWYNNKHSCTDRYIRYFLEKS